jgi:hypothetical protein
MLSDWLENCILPAINVSMVENFIDFLKKRWSILAAVLIAPISQITYLRGIEHD